jgi:hypothetical protein
MDGLSSKIEYEDHIYIPYRVETLYENPYLVYFLNHGKSLQFLTKKTFSPDHLYRGAINWKNCSYLFYEITNVEREFLSSEKEEIWKVTPYEILYTRQVTDVPIHQECVDFFKAFPQLCVVDKNSEVPVVSYLGVGVSEIKEQILLQKNEKLGIFGNGYYFTNYEDALYNAYYKEETDDYLIRLENKSHLSDKVIKNDSVHIKENSFYHGPHYLGEVPECKKNIKYFIYYYDDEVIYLRSFKPNDCKKEIQLRNEPGYVMRYILFLKKHSMDKGKGDYDSYASDSLYMVKNSDHFICLSYHFIKKK